MGAQRGETQFRIRSARARARRRDRLDRWKYFSHVSHDRDYVLRFPQLAFIDPAASGD